MGNHKVGVFLLVKERQALKKIGCVRVKKKLYYR